MDEFEGCNATTSVYTFHCACQRGRGPAHPAHPVKVFMGPRRLRDVAVRLRSASLVPVCSRRGEVTLHLWTLGSCWGLEICFTILPTA
jgi:hypothetical protein